MTWRASPTAVADCGEGIPFEPPPGSRDLSPRLGRFFALLDIEGAKPGFSPGRVRESAAPGRRTSVGQFRHCQSAARDYESRPVPR
jgi:hypothetical protein